MVKRFRESDIGLKGDKGPKWDGRPASWSAFWYAMKVYLALQKLKETVAGTDRDQKDSDDPLVRAGYERRSVKLWWYMMRAISDRT